MKARTRFQRKLNKREIISNKRGADESTSTTSGKLSRARPPPTASGLGINDVGLGKNFALRYKLARATRARKRVMQESVMTICERCGTENLDGSRYCDDCGAAL